MNVFLDDQLGYEEDDKHGKWRSRLDPGGWGDDEDNPMLEWEVVRKVEDCIALLELGGVEVLSLDYDLSWTDREHTGRDVLRWLFKKVTEELNTDVVPERIHIHSGHPKGAYKMMVDVDTIEKRVHALRVQREREASEGA